MEEKNTYFTPTWKGFFKSWPQWEESSPPISCHRFIKTMDLWDYTPWGGEENGERIIIHICWQCPFEARLPMFEHADVCTSACSNIGQIDYKAEVWTVYSADVLTGQADVWIYHSNFGSRRLPRWVFSRLPICQQICTIIRSQKYERGRALLVFVIVIYVEYRKWK